MLGKKKRKKIRKKKEEENKETERKHTISLPILLPEDMEGSQLNMAAKGTYEKEASVVPVTNKSKLSDVVEKWKQCDCYTFPPAKKQVLISSSYFHSRDWEMIFH